MAFGRGDTFRPERPRPGYCLEWPVAQPGGAERAKDAELPGLGQCRRDRSAALLCGSEAGSSLTPAEQSLEFGKEPSHPRWGLIFKQPSEAA